MNVLANNPCEYAIATIQECLAAMPVIVLGSGHSASLGLPGMDKLRDHLLQSVPPRIHPDDKETWKVLEDAVQRKPLESALHEVHLRPKLMSVVIDETWKCCFPQDQKVLEDIIRGICDIPLSRLYAHLFRSTHARLHVVTTNYDRLAEFAADAAGYGWTTGFGQGYIGHRHGGRKLTVHKDGIITRMVDIWKVHGSLDWFALPNGTMFCLPATSSPLEGLQPLMVVPGVDKYRRAYDEPFRSAIAGADLAIAAGNAFLCIGYGFNDEHIQPPLLERCRRQGKLLVVLAKALTPAARTVLLDGRCHCFAAFEETQKGTRMFWPENLAGIDLDGINLWSLDQLLEKVL